VCCLLKFCVAERICKVLILIDIGLLITQRSLVQIQPPQPNQINNP